MIRPLTVRPLVVGADPDSVTALVVRGTVLVPHRSLLITATDV